MCTPPKEPEHRTLRLRIEQDWFWYNSSNGNAASNARSGAYIFRPNASRPFRVAANARIERVVRGRLGAGNPPNRAGAPFLNATGSHLNAPILGELTSVETAANNYIQAAV